MGLGVSPLLLRPKKKRRHLMCVPFEIASFLQLEFLRGRFATTG